MPLFDGLPCDLCYDAREKSGVFPDESTRSHANMAGISARVTREFFRRQPGQSGALWKGRIVFEVGEQTLFEQTFTMLETKSGPMLFGPDSFKPVDGASYQDGPFVVARDANGNSYRDFFLGEPLRPIGIQAVQRHLSATVTNGDARHQAAAAFDSLL